MKKIIGIATVGLMMVGGAKGADNDGAAFPNYADNDPVYGRQRPVPALPPLDARFLKALEVGKRMTAGNGGARMNQGGTEGTKKDMLSKSKGGRDVLDAWSGMMD